MKTRTFTLAEMMRLVPVIERMFYTKITPSLLDALYDACYEFAGKFQIQFIQIFTASNGELFFIFREMKGCKMPPLPPPDRITGSWG